MASLHCASGYESTGARINIRSVLLPLVALAVGIGLWGWANAFALGSRGFYPGVLIPLAFAAGARLKSGHIEHISAALQRPIWRNALLVFLVASIYLIATATLRERTFAPQWHDEFSYLLQSHMIVDGKFWTPAYPLADMIDTFHIISQPVRASMYFPGAAMFYAIGILLSLPSWALPLLATALSAAFIYLICAKLGSGLGGVVGALIFLSSPAVRMASIMVLSQPVLSMLLGATWLLYLLWHQSRRLAYILGIGALGGWAIITRPAEAACFLAPLGLAIVVELLGQPAKRWMVVIGCGLVTFVPFVALQGYINHGVTGDWRTSPYELYIEQHYPALQLGFHEVQADSLPRNTTLQKEAFRQDRVHPEILKHNQDGWWSTLRQRFAGHTNVILPSPIFIVLIPLAALLMCRKQWFVWLTFVLVLSLYTLYPILGPQYSIILAIPVIVGLAMLPQNFDRLDIGPRWIVPALFCALTVSALGSMPPINLTIKDESFSPQELKLIRDLRDDLEKPAIVLFRYAPGISPDIEPVQNYETAWPDEAPIIYGHDMGPRNIEMAQYFRDRQPNRSVYLFDRANMTITYLGKVSDLLGEPSDDQKTTQPSGDMSPN